MFNKVIYHGPNCPDGFGSALAVWLRWGDIPSYIPLDYQEPPPTITSQDSVLILDFSFTRPVMEKIRVVAQKILVIDHHESALLDLKNFEFAIFNMNKAGCVMTWEYLHPNDPLPILFKYLQDRDLWSNELPFTREINCAVAALPHDFQTWAELVYMSEDNFLEYMKSSGELLLKDRLEEEMEKTKAHTWMNIGGYRVPVTYASRYQSDICEHLLKMFPSAPFAAAYRDDIDNSVRHWNLRSRRYKNQQEVFSVNTIAHQFNGGGHPTAAGFETIIGFEFPEAESLSKDT